MSATRGDGQLAGIMERLRRFAADREWEQFHDPENLAMALASEAGELLAELRWVRSEAADSHLLDQKNRERVVQEVADVAIALLLFCERTGIDLLTAVDRKIGLNEVRYPVTHSRGCAERPTLADSEASPLRVVAVDWSGEASGGKQTIWLAEMVDGELVRLENGRSRRELTDELILMSSRGAELLVGLDFAFGFPEWYLEQKGIADALDLWRHVAEHGERWLSECTPPFWGRPGKAKPDLREHFRKTEIALQRVSGSQPKSVFQIGGAGAVGTGSLRGMPELARLHDAGFSIWPFDAPKLPMVVEIYPRILTGPVVKSNAAARRSYLDEHFPEVTLEVRERASRSEDAFDAAVSALVMWAHRTDLVSLALSDDSRERREGAIWAPVAMREGSVAAPVR